MLKLIIADKAYSSWSLRPWLLMTQAGIAFEEVRLRFGSPTYQAEFKAASNSGKVPVLVLQSGQQVWDSLAIAETLNEMFPEKNLWPKDAAARAHARSIVAEMHSGFHKLRANMPMHLLAKFPGRGWNLEVQKDVDRLCCLWTECLEKSGGPLLFGSFSIADAFYAPVLTRLDTYAVEVPPHIRAYMDRVFALPAMQSWLAKAKQEFEFVDFEEPYRSAP
jgi:glutathione S-transferase